MKKLLFVVLLIPIIFLDYGCEDNSTDPNYRDTTDVVARKPNLYIYPDETLELSIQLDFPKGGEIIESIPSYYNSWEITVEPNGTINELYDYLFYECRMPNLTQKETGWVVKTENLKEFFLNNLEKSGFNQYEIIDFIDYWIPIINEYKYYEVYPQYKTIIDKLIKINFSVDPDNFYRLFYLIIGRDDDNLSMAKPIIKTAKRENYFSMEWGVIIN
jgi:hypothetical protein